jgi:plastocyanin
MKFTRTAATASVVAAGAALIWGGAAPAGAGTATKATAAATKVKKVRIFDNYYSPAKLRIRSGTRVQWVWPSDVGDTHDVKLRKGPKGVKKFQSPPFAAEAKWPRKPMTFKKAGTYRLYCTFHETEMTMTIVVKRPS